eukprot:TRINITY_DN35022_c0_g1_i2.p1 TRINITY_DN35022_c0_g1~~TRINITY_DN35022_c0_g1_i2.p1  ORF type:complete len:523 (-),score=46.22 TRINITY_DN35022_c0_g1_i2:93-1661(-)
MSARETLPRPHSGHRLSKLESGNFDGISDDFIKSLFFGNESEIQRQSIGRNRMRGVRLSVYIISLLLNTSQQVGFVWRVASYLSRLSWSYLSYNVLRIELEAFIRLALEGGECGLTLYYLCRFIFAMIQICRETATKDKEQCERLFRGLEYGRTAASCSFLRWVPYLKEAPVDAYEKYKSVQSARSIAGGARRPRLLLLWTLAKIAFVFFACALAIYFKMSYLMGKLYPATPLHCGDEHAFCLAMNSADCRSDVCGKGSSAFADFTGTGDQYHYGRHECKSALGNELLAWRVQQLQEQEEQLKRYSKAALNNSCVFAQARVFKMWLPTLDVWVSRDQLRSWLWDWWTVLTVLNQFASMVDLKEDRLHRLEGLVWAKVNDDEKERKRYDFYGALSLAAFRCLTRMQATTLLLTFSDKDFETFVVEDGQGYVEGYSFSIGSILGPRRSGPAQPSISEPEPPSQRPARISGPRQQPPAVGLKRRTGLCLLRALHACEDCVLHVFECDAYARGPPPSSIELESTVQ